MLLTMQTGVNLQQSLLRKLVAEFAFLAFCFLPFPSLQAQSCIAPNFASAVNYAVGVIPLTVAVGDLNGDGKADLATANFGSNRNGTISVLLNNGNGTYAAAVNYPVGTSATSIAMGDLNGDGKADLVVTNVSPDHKVSVLLNNGNGTFTAALNYAVGIEPYSVTIGDLNGDGKADLVTANSGDNTVSVLLNSGNGTFAAAVNYIVGASPASVAIGDLNGDGKADLAVANPGSTPVVSVLRNNGNGTFAAAVNYSVGDYPKSVVIGDLNGDGKADLATANAISENVSVLLNNGNGTFVAAVNYAVGYNPQSVAIGDLNGDGKADLAAANSGRPNYYFENVSVLRNNGNGTFAAAVNYTVGAQPNSVAIGDLNGDGKADLAVANITGDNVSVLLNTCNVLDCSNDNTPPVLVAKNAFALLDAVGNASIVPADVIQSLTDNCDPNPAVLLSRSTFSCADIVKVPASAGDYQAYNVGSSTGNQVWEGELGLVFKVVNPLGIVVKQLGAFDHQGNGITGTQGVGNNSIRVAVFNNATQTIVAGLDEFINGNVDAYIGNHRMKNVIPVMLPPGIYTIVAKGYNATELNGNRNIPGTPASATDLIDGIGAIAFIASSYGNNTPVGFAYPLNAYPDVNPWLAGTLKFDVPTGGTTTTNTAIVAITATDNHGNAAHKNAVVTVLDPSGVCGGIPPCLFDTKEPTLVTRNVSVNLDATGHASIVPAAVIQSLTDNCDLNPAVQLSRSSFSCADIVITPAGAGNFQAYNVGTSTGNQGWQGELGLVFRVNNPQGIIVKQLGAFDHLGNGISGGQGNNNSIRVAIYNAVTHNIVPGLDEFITGSGDTYTGNHRMKNVVPVTLPPGMYAIVAKGYNATEQNGNRNIPGIPTNASDLGSGNGAITFIGSAYGDDVQAGFSYPANSYPAVNPWLAGTLKFDVPIGGSIIFNTVAVVVTATDSHGNSTQKNAVVTVQDPLNACTPTPMPNSDIVTAKEWSRSEAGLKVYPNPTGGQFTLQLFNLAVPNVTILILDGKGTTVHQKFVALTGKTEMLTVPFNLANKASGMYTIKVISNNGVQTTKVILGR
jgi:hypothetical protein